MIYIMYSDDDNEDNKLDLTPLWYSIGIALLVIPISSYMIRQVKI